ncbi:GGDEF domain-containing protein [Alkalibacillus almallahensis]|uniref:GGDEF domain-containing protein n=1 Tax=Alkalibacillus almallahensis TaxID=1379154 RepID=UPI001421BF76|nr:GGDEF domain-containing protein [Alkalibacillus almallahensis]NIK12012.1 diguanylate cyclase (GGDEF)-like protein [Alkalibacillus almallahensis]
MQVLNQSDTLIIQTNQDGEILTRTGKQAKNMYPSQSIFDLVDEQSLTRMKRILNHEEQYTSDIYLKLDDESVPYIVEVQHVKKEFWLIMTPFPESFLESIANIYDTTNQLNELYVEKALNEKQLNDAIKQLKEKSMTDPLTGLYNRQHFYDQIAKLYNANQLPPRLILSVIDFNNLKQINDHYGHLAGDGLLKLFATIVDQYQTDRTQVFRFGGDEFLFITTEYNLADIKQIIHDIDQQFKEESRECSLSFGFVELTANEIESLYDEQNIEFYISKADRAMYDYKQQLKSNEKRLGQD